MDSTHGQGDHEHEPTQVQNAADSAFYTAEFAEVLLQAWCPKQAFGFVPPVENSSHAFVTKNFNRCEWMNDERGLKAVQDEADGLRRNHTWDGASGTTRSNLRHQSKLSGNSVKVAALHVLCGTKHFESRMMLGSIKVG